MQKRRVRNQRLQRIRMRTSLNSLGRRPWSSKTKKTFPNGRTRITKIGAPELTPDMKMGVVPLLKVEQNEFTREMISVQWRDLDPIDLWVISPAGAKNPPVILYLYSYPDANDRYKDNQFRQTYGYPLAAGTPSKWQTSPRIS